MGVCAQQLQCVHRFKTSDKLPAHVPRDFQLRETTMASKQAASSTEAVSGANRFLYAKRPLLAKVSSQPQKLTGKMMLLTAKTGPLSGTKL